MDFKHAQPASEILPPAGFASRGAGCGQNAAGFANRGMKRGQSASEILVLAGFALAFILPLAFLFLSSASNEIGKSSVLQAKISARTIADEAGLIYLQGPGAKKTVTVHYPDGVRGGAVENGLIILTVDSGGRELDVVASTFAALSPSSNLDGRKNGGLHRINIENVANEVVITYG